MVDDLAARIEALLFMEGGVLTVRKLARSLGVKDEAVREGLGELRERLAGRGLALITTDEQVTLAAAPELAPMLEKIYEGELTREIGDAGLEVLAIVLYRGPSTRAQVEYIRGVNTSSTIRTLISRNLLERIPNPDDAREYLYKPTTELLAHLGVQDVASLPEYTAIKDELLAFERRQDPVDEHGQPRTQ